MKIKRQKLDLLKNRYTNAIGFLGALSYAVFAWGVDGYLLQQNNGSAPWLKLLICFPAVVLIFLAATRISTKSNNLIVRSLIWMAVAIILSILVSFLTFQGSEIIIKAMYPDKAGMINYALPETISGRLFVIIVMSIILFFIGGMLIDSASEALIKSSGIIGWVLPVIFCLAFFGGAGYVADANFNFQLRNQIMIANQQISEASQINSTQMTERQEKLIHRFTKLNVSLDGSRHLLVGSFDASFSQSEILIDFGETWARCTALNGLVGNCERITN